MNEELNREEIQESEYMPPGEQWAKRLGLVGGIAVLLFSLVFVLTMLSAGPEKLEYVPQYDTAYYAANPDVLQDELARQVLPHVEGVESCEVRDGKLVVSIRMSCFIETRAVIIDLFDRDLFEFVQV